MKQITLVEDDPGILDSMALILRRTGYSVTTFASGELILKNEFTPPDLFLIDKQLSGVDGLYICSHLKSQEHTKHIPVIIVSASPNVKALAMQAKADDFLEKPFIIKTLRDMIAIHLNKEAAGFSD